MMNLRIVSLSAARSRVLVCRRFKHSVLKATAQPAMSVKELDHKTAVCFVPHRRYWDNPIQEIRCFHDKGFVRWPPHINLLYPFWKYSSAHFEEAAGKLRRCLEPFKSFDVEFKRFRYFDHGNTCTVWLEPQSNDLKAIQGALVGAFPECYHLSDDPSRDITEYTPHLSVGQWPNARMAEEAIGKLSINFKPLTMHFDGVVLLNRPAYQAPFDFKYKIPLGASTDDAIQELNISYAATIGGTEKMCEEHPYGLGSYAQGIWNFAYGANVNQDKVIVDRKITPFESLPGFLEGYKLSFNHQGGMGNVEPMSLAATSYFKARGIHGVHGILHRLCSLDYARMCNMESGYKTMEMDVKASDGRRIRSVVFVSPLDRNIADGLPPPDRYLDLIIRGAREWNLNGYYLRWLEGLEGVPYKNRGPLYWRTPEGQRIPHRVFRVASDPPGSNRSLRIELEAAAAADGKELTDASKEGGTALKQELDVQQNETMQ